MAEKKYTHKCDYCGIEFKCNEHWKAPGGAIWCHCDQEIVQDEGKEVPRLAFWCSDVCYDAEYPDPGDDDEELPDLLGDGDEDRDFKAIQQAIRTLMSTQPQ